MSGFRVGLSPDFQTPDGQPIVSAEAFGLLRARDSISWERILAHAVEYEPEQLAPYDVVLSLKPRVAARSLVGVERLCAIGRCGVGFDNVDLDACTAADVAVYITPEAVVRPMAESIVLFVLALSHGLVRKDRMTRRGEWSRSKLPLGRAPRGRTIGTIGFGRIAREAVRLLRILDPAAVLAFDPYADPESARTGGVRLVTLAELLGNSDFILVNCPLTAETRGLIDRKSLASVKPGAVLVNTARGAIVDEDALADALASGRLAGAALDVFDEEPLTDSRLFQLDNVILTSHSIGWTEELFHDIVHQACQGAVAIAAGEPPANVVNTDVLQRPGFLKKLASCRQRAHRSVQPATPVHLTDVVE